jgi:ABC-type dipeptide/oligopeptide/nickel transport system permease component
MQQLAQVDIRESYFGSHPVKNTSTVSEFISNVIPNILILASVILFLYLIFGGFLIVQSAGNPEGTDQGKDVIKNAIIGFIIIFASYWIIQIIQVITGIQILNPSL